MKELKTEAPVKDTIVISHEPEIEVKPSMPVFTVSYHSVPVTLSLIENPDSLYTPEQLSVIYALNRIDKEHFWRTDSLIVPDSFLTDLHYYSPFPDSLSFLSNVRKLLMFSYAVQAFAVYENGILIKWGPVSMGKRSTPTPTGLFSTNWKAKETVSTVDEEWIMNWYFNLINFQGVSMHQYDLPGYPASHACVRLLEDDAKWLYQWADQWVLSADDRILAYGTPVFIYGKYPFGKPKPWKELSRDAEYTDQPTDSIMVFIEPYLTTILERQSSRDSLNLVRNDGNNSADKY